MTKFTLGPTVVITLTICIVSLSLLLSIMLLIENNSLIVLVVGSNISTTTTIVNLVVLYYHHCLFIDINLSKCNTPKILIKSFFFFFSDPYACQRQFRFSQQDCELVCVQLPAGTPHPWPHLLNQPIGAIQEGGGAIVTTNQASDGPSFAQSFGQSTCRIRGCGP